jgi:hypothetical protein
MPWDEFVKIEYRLANLIPDVRRWMDSLGITLYSMSHRSDTRIFSQEWKLSYYRRKVRRCRSVRDPEDDPGRRRCLLLYA